MKSVPEVGSIWVTKSSSQDANMRVVVLEVNDIYVFRKWVTGGGAYPDGLYVEKGSFFEDFEPWNYSNPVGEQLCKNVSLV